MSNEAIGTVIAVLFIALLIVTFLFIWWHARKIYQKLQDQNDDEDNWRFH